MKLTEKRDALFEDPDYVFSLCRSREVTLVKNKIQINSMVAIPDIGIPLALLLRICNKSGGFSRIITSPSRTFFMMIMIVLLLYLQKDDILSPIVEDMPRQKKKEERKKMKRLESSTIRSVPSLFQVSISACARYTLD